MSVSSREAPLPRREAPIEISPQTVSAAPKPGPKGDTAVSPARERGVNCKKTTQLRQGRTGFRRECQLLTARLLQA